MKSIEQRRGVKTCDLIRCIRFDRGPQLLEIAAHARRIQQQSIAGRRDCFVTERRAQYVHSEIEQTPRAGRVLFRPEHRHRPLARERLRPGRNDQRQECNAVSLRWWTTERSIAGAQAGAAEELNRDHRLSQLIPG